MSQIGLVGNSLQAQLLNKSFWTLSVWRDESSLDTFLQALPHLRIMQQLRPYMGQTQFVRWQARGAELPPTWPDAMKRLTATPDKD